jgi:hypothetical protein
MNYYKILKKDECHHGYQFTTGLNVDFLPFNPSGDCTKGGLYFAREDILAFLHYGVWIREVELPELEPVYENPGFPKKWKAHRIILHERRRINADVVQALLASGADVHADDDYALRWSSASGHHKVVQVLKKYIAL